MKRFIISLLVVVVAAGVKAQTDPVAFSVLDRFSRKATEAPSVTMSFNLRIEDAVEGSVTEDQGTIVISGDRYRLDLQDNIIWFDGEAIYTLAPEVEEVTITEPDPESSEFINSPSSLFTMYRAGYKIRLVGESPEGSLVDLYPEDLAAEFSRIRLLLTKDNDLSLAEYRRKDGITITIDVSDYNTKKSYRDDYFTFDRKKYGNVDVIDMRF